jgi:acyl dehydratase
MGAWVIDYMSGWAGELGIVVHSVANFRGPALSGDVTMQTAEVVEKTVDADGRHLVHLTHRMANQKGTNMATGAAEIALPKRLG